MKKNYFYNLSLTVTNILFPLLSFPYASRVLGMSGIGKVQLATSFAQYFALFAALGIPVYGVQEIAKIRHNRLKLNAVFSELLTIYFVTSLIVTAVYAIVIFSFPFFRPNIEVYVYAGLTILLGFSSIDWLYSGLEDFRSLARRTILVKVAALLLLFLFVKTAADFKIYLLVTIFSLMGNNFLNLAMINGKAAIVMPGRDILRHLKPLLYLFSTSVAASLYTILDTVLLGFLADEKAVGLYTAAIKLSKVSLPFITSAGTVMIAQISKAMEVKDYPAAQSLLSRPFHFIVFFSLPVVAGLTLLAPEFIQVFSGSDFHAAVDCMRIVAWLPALIGLGYFFAILVLVPGGYYKQMFYSVLGGVFLCLILSFLLVPRYREVGTAIANISSELLVTCLYFVFVRKRFDYTYKWSYLFRAAGLSILFWPLISAIRWLHFNALPTLLFSIAICGMVYFILQYTLFKDKLVTQLTGPLLQKLRPVKKEQAD
jgi:O-antigen/teichoic acid export membrane protein